MASVKGFLTYIGIALLSGAVSFGALYANKLDFSETGDPQNSTSLKVEIIGPSTLDVGKLAVLESKVEGATTQLWYPLDPLYTHTCSDNKSLIVTGDRSEIRTYVLFVSNGTESVFTEHVIEIVSKTPPNGPPEGPPSDNSLVNLTKTWLKSVDQPSLTKQQVVREAFTSVISAANSNKFTNTDELDTALTVLLLTAIDGDKGWQSFGLSYNTEINRLKKSEISDVKSYVKYLSQVAEGLK